MPKSNRAKSNFTRSISDLSPRDRILIVCEDSVTTPNYLKDFCGSNGLRLSPATDIYITGECGSSPKNVYDYALKLLQIDIDKNGIEEAYDKIFCVIDRDAHPDYHTVIKNANDRPAPNGKQLKIINSVPCFEVWILFHYIDSDKPLQNCDAVIKELKKYPDLSKYTKKYPVSNLYEILKNKTPTAIANSKSVNKRVLSAGTDNPFSLMHVLVEEIIKQSKRSIQS